MRIVLQNCQTSLFVLGAEDWTEDKKAARAFDNSGEASSFIRARGLNNMQVVYEFDEPPYHATLPVSSGGYERMVCRHPAGE